MSAASGPNRASIDRNNESGNSLIAFPCRSAAATKGPLVALLGVLRMLARRRRQKLLFVPTSQRAVVASAEPTGENA